MIGKRLFVLLACLFVVMIGFGITLPVHRDIFHVMTARWLGLAAREGRYFYLATASVSVLGYHHDVDEPVIHLWNDERC